MNKFTVLTPTFNSPHLIDIFVRSFSRFCPKDIECHFVIVENSTNTDYRDHVLSLAKNITWIQNPINEINSEANGIGVKRGLKEIDDDFVFVAHCDTCVTSESFFYEMIEKKKEGFKMIGTVLDPGRIEAVHISGFYVEKELIDSVDIMPVYEAGLQVLDVGDSLTKKCRDENIPHFCFRNTFNDHELAGEEGKKFKAFHVDRCLDSNNSIMFMHLGRGIPKTQDTYRKPNRVYLDGWYEFCNNLIDGLVAKSGLGQHESKPKGQTLDPLFQPAS